MPEVYAAGTPPEQLRKFLARVVAVGGGTLPESSLPALMKAAAMLEVTEQGVPRVVLHVTDAPPHDPEAGHTARSVLEAFKQERVLYFGCTPDIEPYRTFANVTGGTLFPIEPDMRSKTFEAVLQDFARTTVKTVRAAGRVSRRARCCRRPRGGVNSMRPGDLFALRLDSERD